MTIGLRQQNLKMEGNYYNNIARVIASNDYIFFKIYFYWLVSIDSELLTVEGSLCTDSNKDESS